MDLRVDTHLCRLRDTPPARIYTWICCLEVYDSHPRVNSNNKVPATVIMVATIQRYEYHPAVVS